MNAPLDLAQLARQVHWLKFYCLLVTALLAVVLLTAAAKTERAGELTVERLNIVDAAGKPRLVLANAERFPPPVINGKTYKRAINPAGIVFYNGNGDEVGGLALTDLESGRLTALAFDYAHSDAMGLVTRISPDGKDAAAGLVINSRPGEALQGPAAMSAAQRRIELQNHNEVAELVLSDSKGRPRLRVFVGQDDHPAIEMLDESGKSVYSERH